MNFLRGIGPLEFFNVVIIMVVFGVGKLPEVGEGLGRGIRLLKLFIWKRRKNRKKYKRKKK